MSKSFFGYFLNYSRYFFLVIEGDILDVNNFKFAMCEALTFQDQNLSVKEYSVGAHKL